MFSISSIQKSDSNELSPSQTSSSSSTTTTSSLSSTSASLLENSSDSDPQVGGLFSFEPSLLEPFMGLKGVAHKDDPWNYKPYNLYRPIFTGGGTFEEYLKTGRYRRDVNRSPQSYSNRNVLTPDMLERLLRIKMNFQKNYPYIYKTMMGHMTGDKSTSLSITPPKIPQHVSYPNLELAAAEINPLSSLVKTYEQDIQNIQLLAQQNQQHSEPLTNSYDKELHYWENPQEPKSSPSYNAKEYKQETSQEPKSSHSYNEENHNWESPQKPKNSHFYNEESHNWETPQEPRSSSSHNEENHSLETPSAPINIYSNTEEKSLAPQSYNEEKSFWEHFQESLSPQSQNEEQSFWENPQETLKTLHEQQNLLANPQETLTSLNDEQSIWENSKEALQPSTVQKRNSFWTELEAAEEKQQSEDSDRVFNFDEDFD